MQRKEKRVRDFLFNMQSSIAEYFFVAQAGLRVLADATPTVLAMIGNQYTRNWMGVLVSLHRAVCFVQVQVLG